MEKVGVLWFQAVLTLGIKTMPLQFMSHFPWQFLVCKNIPCCSHDFHKLSLSQGVLTKKPKMTEMIELEDQEELLKNEQDVETAAYKEAFDHFDWNHSGRIPTSVSE